VPRRHLLGDEAVGRLGIGDPEQRLGEAHQDDALLAREAVLAHEGIDAGVLLAVGAGGVDEAAGEVRGAAALVLGVDGALDQAADETRLLEQVISGDLVARRQLVPAAPAGRICRFCCFRHRDHALSSAPGTGPDDSPSPLEPSR
jgi:hypothetical protein